MIKPTINNTPNKLYTIVSYAKRTPITNKIKPETNFIVFPTFSPLSIIITLLFNYYLIYSKPFIKLMEKKDEINRKKLLSNTFYKNSNINIVKNPRL